MRRLLVVARAARCGGHYPARPLAEDERADEHRGGSEHEAIGAHGFKPGGRQARADPGAAGDSDRDHAEESLTALDVEEIRGEGPELGDAHDAEKTRPDEEGQPDAQPRLAEQEENHEIGGKEGTDDLEHAARVHGAHQQAIRRNDPHQEQRLEPHGVAPELGIPFGEDERFADRADEVIGHHERGGLQQQHGNAASFTRLHFRGQGEESLESA